MVAAGRGPTRQVCQHEGSEACPPGRGPRAQGVGDVHRNVRQVVEAGKALGVDVHAREFSQGTRTAADAAEAIGVELGQIIKSLVFAVDSEVVVALVSGENLLDEDKLAAAAGGYEAWREDADTVRETTGF